MTIYLLTKVSAVPSVDDNTFIEKVDFSEGSFVVPNYCTSITLTKGEAYLFEKLEPEQKALIKFQSGYHKSFLYAGIVADALLETEQRSSKTDLAVTRFNQSIYAAKQSPSLKFREILEKLHVFLNDLYKEKKPGKGNLPTRKLVLEKHLDHSNRASEKRTLKHQEPGLERPAKRKREYSEEIPKLLLEWNNHKDEAVVLDDYQTSALESLAEGLESCYSLVETADGPLQGFQEVSLTDVEWDALNESEMMIYIREGLLNKFSGDLSMIGTSLHSKYVQMSGSSEILWV